MNKIQGISLIETLISLTIVGVAIIALLPVMTLKKTSNDPTHGNLLWVISDNAGYYNYSNNVSIGSYVTTKNFLVDNTGFRNSDLSPLYVRDILRFGNMQIEGWDNTLYINNALAEKDASKGILISDNLVIANNGSSNYFKKTDKNNITISDRSSNFYSISNQNNEYLYLDATNKVVAIGKNAGININPLDSTTKNYIAVYNNSSPSPPAESVRLIIGYDKSKPVIQYYDNSGFTINANITTNTFVAGAVIIPSDKRLKNIISGYKKGLKEILRVKPVAFTFKNDKKQTKHIGVIAQDLKKPFPEAVVKNKDTGHYMITTGPLLYALFNAIRELNDKNIQLKKNNDELEQKVIKLRKIKEELKASKGGNDVK